MLADPAGGPSGTAPLPPVVRWMVSAGGDFTDFNQSIVLLAPEEASIADLRRLVAEVVAVHPMLAARLAREAGEWTLAIGTALDVAGAVSEAIVDAAPGTDVFERAVVDAHAAAAARLDPAAGRVLQVVLVRGTGGARLVVVGHHLAVDAVSWPMLVEDLFVGWAQLAAGEPIVLRAEQTSARAWYTALDARRDEVATQRDFWLHRSGTTDLGVDVEAPTRWADTSAVDVTVPAPVSGPLLTSVPEAFGANTADVLMGALARAVRGWQRAKGIADDAPVTVLSEGHGRYEDVLESGADPRRADLARTVGWFTSIAPLRVEPGADVVHAVKAAKEERLALPGYGLGYGLLRYEQDSPLAGPLPSITFNYLGARTAAAADEASAQAMTPDPHAPALPGSVTGEVAMMSPLTINAVAGASTDGPVITADVRHPSSMSRADVDDLVTRWQTELARVVASVDARDPGLSPSDVPAARVTQGDLDAIARSHPGADVWGLSPLQRGLYFHSFVATTTGAPDVYVVAALLTLRGEVDLERLHRAADGLLQAHPVLRSAFVTTGDGEQVAIVADDVRVPWRVVDLGDADDAQDRVRELVEHESIAPFDLSAAPLLRFLVARHGDQTDVLVVAHHLVIDGWSSPLVMADLMALYATGSTFTPRDGAVGFKEYLRSIEGRDTVGGLDAWRRVLAPAEGPTLIAPGAEVEPDALPATLSIPVPADLAGALDRTAREHGATVSTVLQLAWALFLSRRTGNRAVTFGETVSGRPADLDGIESVVGLFINTLPVVVDVDPDQSLAQLLEHLQADKVALLDYHHIGLSEIGAAAGDIGFDTLVVHESYPVDADSLADAGDGTGGLVIAGAEFSDATHYPLNMITAGDGTGLTVNLKYLPGAFAADEVADFGAMLLRILDALGNHPRTRAAEVSLLDDEGRAAILSASSGPVETVPSGSVADAVAAQVARTPDAVALILGDREVAFGEFGARVALLARTLIAAGVGPDVAVGVCIDRSVELMVAVHAVVAAGGQYVPVDVAAPSGRAASMMRTAGARVVLVAAGAVPEAVADLPDVRIVEVDAAGPVDPSVAPIDDAERLGAIGGDSALYTLFTSGSTGEPKGVTVSHLAVRNRLAWMAQDYGLGADETFVLKTPYTFDVSVWELFLPLIVGAPLVLARPDGHRDPQYLAGLIAERDVSVIHFVPSMLSVFCDVTGARLAGLSSLRHVFTSGEALSPAVAQELLAALPTLSLVNLYGPTEAAVDVTAAHIAPGDASVTIGRPVANTSTLVLDDRLAPVPVGVAGELYLGGVQVARGYAAQPGLTAERFVADPYGEPGARLYRTGDVVRWNTDGDIEYLGRSDFQVKLRGQRVELGEIEAAIAAAPGVVHAAATVATAPGGGEFLVGYFAPASADLAAVRAHVAARLPDYMRPTVWTPLQDVTLGATGKLDRKGLPAPDLSSLVGEYVAPEGSLEESVAEVFADVLGVERVSATESFFDLGGNSLSAMRLAARLGDRDIAVDLPRLFEHPTVRELAEAVHGDIRSSGVVIRLRTGGDGPALFCFHPADGLAWAYAELVPHIPGRPVYGLQDPAVVAGEERLGSIGDFAERYIDEIKQVVPEGPYHLLGWSLGGVIAFEVATRLRRRGDEVAFLGLMDPAAGSAYTAEVSRDEHDTVVADLRRAAESMGLGAEAMEVDPDTAREETIAAQLAVVGSAPRDQVHRMIDALDAGADLLPAYRPGEFDGRALFVSAVRGKDEPHRLLEFWRPHLTGALSEVDADVEHGAMGTTEGFALIGPVIGAALAELTANPDDREDRDD
ncbi:amino acid adenylation domain-containing protein [Gordonia sp. (in: high G+C Gram-positive bacteria)]|uniref:amino acid adenylation domain-containing protein n=1 Tax=Gordonia sp. (in: high G+C Gram-positive bacteria) TaxID=84139 RepID=UPI0039E28803